MRDAQRPRGDRPRLARVVQTLGVVLGVVAILLSGLRLAVVNEDRFAAAAGKAIGAPAVSALVGERLTDHLVAAEPDLLAVQPVVQTAITGVVGSGAGAGVVRTTARQLHRTAVAGDPDTALLRLGTLGLLAVQSLRALSPDVADRIPPSVDAALVSLDDGSAADVASEVTEAAGTVRWSSWVAVVLAAVLLAAAVLLRRDRAAALRRTGLAIAGAGLAAAVAFLLIRTVVVGAVTDRATHEAGLEVYDAFLGDATSLASAVVAAGLLLTVAVGALTRSEALTVTARRRVAAVGADPRGRRALGLGVAAVGGLLLLDRDLAAQLLATAAGLGLLAVGLETALRRGATDDGAASDEHGAAVGEPEVGRRTALSRPSTPAGPTSASEGGGRRGRRSRTAVRRGLAVAAAAVVGLVLIGGTTERALSVGAPPSERCNGAAALCDRRLDQVAIPATHNSYSSAADGFLLANQQTGIADQLRGGVRGFLIDTYLAQPTSRGVFTRLDLSPNSREKVESSIGPDATRTALRLRERLSSGAKGPLDVYLCHGFCELGATSALDVLREVRTFLEEHPDEVVVFSVEDQVPPARFAQLVDESGLLELTWKGPVAPLPTLGEMVATGGRVLFMAEGDAGKVPWLHQQFALTQETPYDLTTAKQLLGDPGCAANRGTGRAPLFLLNHFLGTVPPRPSAARAVNDAGAIVAHVRRCERLRGRRPNLLAVDFWRTGDVVGAARTLNGVAGRGD